MKSGSLLKFVTASTASVMLLLPGSQYADASGAGKAPEQNSSQAQSNQSIKIMQEKPQVAPVPTNNNPNRIIANFNGDTRTQMGFSWYTTNKFNDAKVWISETGDFSDAQVVNSKPKKVNSKYVERDKNGNFIFADVEKDDEGEIIKDSNGKEKINGYYTDENASGAEWTSGDKHGKS